MHGAGESGAAEARSVAVLPFVNMSGDAENEYFSDGISEEILNVLARVLMQTQSLPLQPIVAGRYHDEFRRAVHWSFARRHMIVDLVGDLAQHLLFEYRHPD